MFTAFTRAFCAMFVVLFHLLFHQFEENNVEYTRLLFMRAVYNQIIAGHNLVLTTQSLINYLRTET